MTLSGNMLMIEEKAEVFTTDMSTTTTALEILKEVTVTIR